MIQHIYSSNLLTLIHGLENQKPPATGRLRGQEFKDACRILQQIKNGPVNESSNDRPSERPNPQSDPATTEPVKDTGEPKRNIPLIRSSNEKAIELATLYEDLVSDIAAMPPEAARYFRDRPWLTNELCQKWGIGFLPMNGRSMFRGWIVYTHRNQRGEVISYSGRDPKFDTKWNRWIRDGKPATKKPMKHRYVKGFHKGMELYGQHQQRLDDPNLIESLQANGLFVVEGMNDVACLDQLGVAAVGTCSNRATETQVAKIAGFAKEVAGGRVVLMPDCDEEGESGFKDLMWLLAEQGVETRLAWSRNGMGGGSEGLQPENVTESQLQEILEHLR